MNFKKIKTHKLEKCYSIAPLKYNQQDYILVAAEKINKCLLFDLDGNLIDTIWDAPGGTMSMVQIPNSNGQFLATQKFYSPNDSKEAKIVLVKPVSQGKWEIKTIAKLPFVHRFDIITRKNKYYIIACTIKSDHNYKEDWTHPGQVLVAELPNDLSKINGDNLISFTVIIDGLLKNHGYNKQTNQNNQEYLLIGSENGILEIYPPITDTWIIHQIDNNPCSDMILVDLDNDGQNELVTISPFHGNTLTIYKKINNTYQIVYQYDIPFGHAIWGGQIQGKNCAIIGHRQGNRDLLYLSYNDEYQIKVIDSNVGPANIYKYNKGDIERFVSTNREINEIAFYEVVK